MKKLLCLLTVLAALMAVLVVDLVRDPGEEDGGSQLFSSKRPESARGPQELAGRVATVGRPATAPRQRSSSSSAAELQRVIRQDVE